MTLTFDILICQLLPFFNLIAGGSTTPQQIRRPYIPTPQAQSNYTMWHLCLATGPLRFKPTRDHSPSDSQRASRLRNQHSSKSYAHNRTTNNIKQFGVIFKTNRIALVRLCRSTFHQAYHPGKSPSYQPQTICIIFC